MLAIRAGAPFDIGALIFSTRCAGNQQISGIPDIRGISHSISASMYPVDNKSNVVLLAFLIFLAFSGTNIALGLLRVSQ
jgi:hypothetical protein